MRLTKLLAICGLLSLLPSLSAAPFPHRTPVKHEPRPAMIWQTTGTGSWSPTTVTKSGRPLRWDFGDGSPQERINDPTHTYASAGTKVIRIYIDDGPTTHFDVNSLNLTGEIPDISANTALHTFYVNINSLTGSIPNLSANTALVNFRGYDNSLTGSIPNLSANTALVLWNCYDNSLTGSIPNLSANTALIVFYCYFNQITDYTDSTISLTLVDFRAYNNLLSESAVNQILADFADGIASRPATGTLNIGGTGNAAPTGQGLIDKAAIIAKGWAVTTN